ncbi:MAG TPA: cyclase family protein [Geopsychrobacteraceae bacterium]|nr:cyclase family protein [Geopsychrobacteraceae bacterium]
MEPTIMKIIDLSHAIHPNIPVYPGTEQPVITQANTIERDGFAEKKMAMYSHTATHIDAPSHILAGAKSLDQFPASHFFGQAVLIEITQLSDPEIGIRQLAPYENQLKTAAFALLHTGWSAHWGQDQYFRGFPCLSAQAAEWLTRFPLQGIGVDTISIDHIGHDDLPAHHILLERDIVIIENLTNLNAIAGAAFNFSCLPLPLQDADGSPVRAVAIDPCTTRSSPFKAQDEMGG